MNKKGQLGELINGIVVFGTIVIIMAVIGIVLFEFQDSILVTTPSIIINESFTPTLGVPFQLPHTITDAGVILTNASDGGLYPRNNYTIDIPDARINISEYSGQLLNITYNITATERSAAFNATQGGIDGIETMSNFNTILAIIIISVVLLAMVVTGFLFVTR